jgi:hypothetical protein
MKYKILPPIYSNVNTKNLSNCRGTPKTLLTNLTMKMS